MLEQENNHRRGRNTSGHLHDYAYRHIRYGDTQLSVYFDRELSNEKCADKERPLSRSKTQARFADEVDFKGNANLETHCTGTGVAAIGGSASKLVE